MCVEYMVYGGGGSGGGFVLFCFVLFLSQRKHQVISLNI